MSEPVVDSTPFISPASAIPLAYADQSTAFDWRSLLRPIAIAGLGIALGRIMGAASHFVMNAQQGIYFVELSLAGAYALILAVFGITLLVACSIILLGKGAGMRLIWWTELVFPLVYAGYRIVQIVEYWNTIPGYRAMSMLNGLSSLLTMSGYSVVVLLVGLKMARHKQKHED